MLFQRLLKRLVRTGRLGLIDAHGRRHHFGEPGEALVVVKLHDQRLHWRLAFNPALSVGEAYIDGTLTVAEGTLYQFLEVMARNLDHLAKQPLAALATRLGRRLGQANGLVSARRNVAHHYDLSGEFYGLFLDSDRQYSCAYFGSPDDDLEQAQANKKRHIAAKLLLSRPGLKVLDIGCGWGGLALYLARETGAEVTGITLSVEQHRYAQARAAQAGLSDRAGFQLRDYREIEGKFDRIVSVGMFEHVGKRNYRDFFGRLDRLLADDGVALLHSIGYCDAPGPINPFIAKYIFPGADLPSLSEVFAEVEDTGLIATDLEVLRLHYALTLKAWRERLEANWQAAAALYDQRFCRMWQFYLALCEVGFRHRSTMVFQLQLAKKLDVLPRTRDYIGAWQRTHSAAPAAEARVTASDRTTERGERGEPAELA